MSLTAFATLLLIAFLMGANHVAARFAFAHGVDVTTAIAVRSTVTALVVGLILWRAKVALTLSAKHPRALLAVGFLIAIQSYCLYSAVARLPVALALLGFNTYPLWIALWARVLYKHQPEPAVLRVMPIMLAGLALALDVLGATSGLGAQGQWAVIGEGVFFALAAAALFGIAMVFTQHEAGDLDGRLRTFSTMTCVAILAWLMIGTQTGLHLPDAPEGWLGLCMLSLLYGTGFTIMFTVLPRLGVVGNSAIMNVEPVFALVLAWVLLNQAIAPIQVIGALVVVSTVMYLGLRKR
ncbi:MAG: DMT family transporter [Betaproteobacteria bacterium]|nr:DMT family transporter [Betaproteobacteria bacterium]